MSTPTIAEYLKYANLQMAAEAPLVNPDGTVRADIPGALQEGNYHAFRFTEVQAKAFADPAKGWTVLDQRVDTATGFSGTLFKNNETREVVVSFRSTEFIDDAARDNEATNKLEIGDFGFALGQLSDMEAWYAELSRDGGPLSGKAFSVTGYSLGGHLATAFNLMHPGAASQVVTFNGAGIGKIGDGSLEDTYAKLPRMVARFQELRDQATATGDLEGKFTTPEALTAYRSIKSLIAANGGCPTAEMDTAIPRSDWESLSSLAKEELARLADALATAVKVAKEAVRAPQLQSGAVDANGNPIRPKDVPLTEIAANSLDYQLAVRLTAQEFHTSALSILGGGQNIRFGKTMGSGASSIYNQYDLVGTETTTEPTAMVANSQYHYGVDTHIFIEDQPLYRGTAPTDMAKTSFANSGFKLLVEGYDQNDFGDTHSLVLIVDSLNIQNLLKTLSSETTQSQVENIFKAASAATAESNSGLQGKCEGDVLENVLNAVAKLVLGPSATQLKGKMDGNTWADFDDRTAFYNLLDAITGKDENGTDKSPAFQSLVGNVTVSVPESGVLSDVRDNFVNFLSVLNLSPVMFRVDDAAKADIEAKLGTVWADVYNAWLDDQKLTPAQRSAGLGNYTDTFLNDRARFIGWRAQANLRNKTAVTDSYPDQWLAEERNYRGQSEHLPLSLDVNSGWLGTTGNARRMIFGLEAGDDMIMGGATADRLYGMGGSDTVQGGSGEDWLEGNAGADRLYGQEGRDTLVGGQGDDTLEGGKGSDTLLGGTGSDTYLFTRGDGWDWIHDSDGQGRLVYDGLTLAGGKAVGDSGMVWQETQAGQTFIYLLTDWTEGGETFKRLSIQGPDGGIWVKGWQLGDLGITLAGADTPAPQTTDLYGTATSDNGHLEQTAHHDSLQSTAPDQKVYGQSGSDYLIIDQPGAIGYGGIGNDKIVNGDGNQELWGEEDNDILVASGGNDELYGGTGNDALQGGADNDFLDGGDGMDFLDGGEGSDVIKGGDGDDFILGGGNLTVYLNETPDADGANGYDRLANGRIAFLGKDADGQFVLPVLTGVSAQDSELYTVGRSVVENDGADLIDGGAGNDWIMGGAGGDVIDGGAGRDYLLGLYGNDYLDGGADDDSLHGDGVKGDFAYYDDQHLWAYTYPEYQGDDILDGGDGNDYLSGDGGADELYGGAGNDTLVGDHSLLDAQYHGEDHLDGGEGDDILYGYGKGDELLGGAGNDVLEGDGNAVPYDRHGDDFLDGGEGADTLQGDGGSDRLFGGAGDDRLFGDADDVAVAYQGDDYLDGGDGDDYLRGYAGRDILVGGDGRDQLLAEGGNDQLNGEAGDDILLGGDGDDTLTGGSGTDYLDGGIGNDTYVFGAGDNPVAADGSLETVVDAGGNDTVRFGPGISLEDLKVSAAESGVLLIDRDQDRLAIVGGLTGAIEYFQFADGQRVTYAKLVGSRLDSKVTTQTTDGSTVVLGGKLEDQVSVMTGATTVSGGQGNDILNLAGGNNTVLYSLGDGTDRVLAFGGGNVVRLGPGIAASNLSLGIGPGGELALQVGDDPNDVLLFDNFDAGDPLASLPFARIEFDDGSSLDYEDLVRRGVDLAGGTGDDILVGTGLADRIVGGDGNDLIDGGAGNDRLTGGAGVDVYRLSRGGGADQVVDGGPDINIVRLESRYSPEDVVWERLGDDLRLGLDGSEDSILLTNYFAEHQNWQVDFGASNPISVEDLLARHQAERRAIETLWRDTKADAIAQIESRGADPHLDWRALGNLVFFDPREQYVSSVGTQQVRTTTLFDATGTIIGSGIFQTYEQTLIPFFSTLQYWHFDVSRIESNDAVISVPIPRQEWSTVSGYLQVDWAPLSPDDVSTYSFTNWNTRGGGYGPGDGWTVSETVVETTTRRGQAVGFVAGNGNGARQYTRRDNFEPLVTEIIAGDADNEIQAQGVGTILVDAGAGNDTVFGGPRSLIYGNVGDDSLHGDGSILVGGDGNDHLYGGPGLDRYVFSSSDETGIKAIEDAATSEDEFRDWYYEAQGVADWREAGAWLLAWGESLYHCQSLEEVAAYLAERGDEYTVDDALASGILRRNDEFAPPIIGDSKDFRLVDSLVTNGIVVPDVVELPIGVSPPDLSFAWGSQTGSDGQVRTALEVGWDGEIRFSLALPQAGDAIGWGIEQVKFADGAVLSLADLIDRAPRMPDTGDGVRVGNGETEVIQASDAGERMFGMAGDDALIGGIGNDTLDGGEGNDAMRGSAGNDCYIFGPGDGADAITDQDSTAGNADTIFFRPGIAPEDIELCRDGNDLIFVIKGTDDSLTAKDWFAGNEFRVEQATFFDGTAWNESFLESLGQASGPEPVLLVGSDGNDRLSGTDSDDDLSGLAGDDVLEGGSGNDHLSGGAGNDWLSGGSGRDIYYLGRGDGLDTVDQSTANYDEGDVVRFASGISPSDIVKHRVTTASGWDLVLALPGVHDGVRIVGYGSDYYYKAPSIEFSDGTVWGRPQIDSMSFWMWSGVAHQSATGELVGSAGDDWLSGREGADRLLGMAGIDVLHGASGDDYLAGDEGNDYLIGGPGNDVLVGGAGEDIYVVGRGDGSDSIYESYNSANNTMWPGDINVVRFADDITTTDVRVSRLGDDLVLTIADTGEQVQVIGYWNESMPLVVQMEFSDGTTWGRQQLAEYTVMGEGTDGNVILTGTPGDDVLLGLEGDDELDGGPGNDILQGGSGDDVLLGFDGNDELSGGSGDDELVGEAGDDIYLFGQGDGHDLIWQDANGPESRDIVRFIEGIAPADVIVREDGGGNDLILTLADTGDSVTLVNWWHEPDTRVSAVEFADGTTWNADDLIANLVTPAIIGTEGDDRDLRGTCGDDVVSGLGGNDDLFGGGGSDILDGGSGDDYLEGDDGSDIYVFSRGDGHDYIQDYGTSLSDIDVLRFGSGISPDDIRISSDDWCIYMEIAGTEDSVALDDVFSDDTVRIERVEFEDGTVWSYGDLEAQTVAHPPTNGGALQGTSGDDQLTGTDAADTLAGGAGDDILSGGLGGDTYVFNLGDGVDRIVDTGGADTLVFGTGIDPAAVTLGLGSLLIRTGTGTDAIHIEGFDSQAPLANAAIDTFQFADGTVLSLEQLLARGFDLAGDGDLYGTAMTDRVSGGTGADVLTGSAGDDVLAGGGGNDIYVFRLGGGNDVVIDVAVERAGNRVLFGEGITHDNLVLVHESEGLRIRYSDTDSVLVSGYGAGGNCVIAEVAFADGSVVSLNRLANRAPVLQADLADTVAAEDSFFLLNLPAGIFSDTDPGDTLQYAATLPNGDPLPGWLTFDPAALSFSGTPANQDVGTVRVRLVATDSVGASRETTFGITVANVNDAPTAQEPIAASVAAEDLAFTFTVPDNAFVDVDAGDVLALSAERDNGDPLPGWLAFDPATQTFAGTPGNGDVGSLRVRLTAMDQAGARIDQVFDLGVANVNDAPTVAIPVADQGAIEDQAFLFILPPATFADIDAGDQLAYAATLTDGTPLPGWLSFDSATSSFSGTPANQDVGTARVRVMATDRDGASAESAFSVTVENVNDAPVATGDQATVNEDDTLRLTEATLLANDHDIDATADPLAITAVGNGLHGSVGRDANGAVVFTPETNYSGRASFDYTVSDCCGDVSTATVTVDVAPVNDAPQVTIPLPDQPVAKKADFRWQIPAGSFADVDGGDTLTYSAQLADGGKLPAWLQFDAATQTFSGRVPANAKGNVDVRVTASDGHGADSSVSDVFRISIGKPGKGGQGNGDIGYGDDLPSRYDCDRNDGPGNSLGHSGSRRDVASVDSSDRRHAEERPNRSGDGHSGVDDWFDRGKKSSSSYLDPRNLAQHVEDFEDHSGTRSERHDDISIRWQAMERALADIAFHDFRDTRLDQKHGADTRSLSQVTAGYLGSIRINGTDHLPLLVGSGTQFRDFKGLQEGLRRIA